MIGDILRGIEPWRDIGTGLAQFLPLFLSLPLQRLVFLLVRAYRYSLRYTPRFPSTSQLEGRPADRTR